MSNSYDKYYQTENLFGQAYPELLNFFSQYPEKGQVLDLGCGQGRDAIPLARAGFEVTAIDSSPVGIAQMNQMAHSENLPLTGLVQDIYQYDDFAQFEFVLLDSMFHFTKKDRKKEMEFIQKIFSNIQGACKVIFCIQDSGIKVEILNSLIEQDEQIYPIENKPFQYTFEDKESGHSSTSAYRLLVVSKSI